MGMLFSFLYLEYLSTEKGILFSFLYVEYLSTEKGCCKCKGGLVLKIESGKVVNGQVCVLY